MNLFCFCLGNFADVMFSSAFLRFKADFCHVTGYSTGGRVTRCSETRSNGLLKFLSNYSGENIPSIPSF